MFNTSILENITLGEVFSEQLLEEVIKVTCLNEFVNQYGLEKVIDNEDTNISGEKKHAYL